MRSHRQPREALLAFCHAACEQLAAADGGDAGFPAAEVFHALARLHERAPVEAAALGDGGLARRLGALTMPVQPQRFSFPTQRV